jgi:hypothetical protein
VLLDAERGSQQVPKNGNLTIVDVPTFDAFVSAIREIEDWVNSGEPDAPQLVILDTLSKANLHMLQHIVAVERAKVDRRKDKVVPELADYNTLQFSMQEWLIQMRMLPFHFIATTQVITVPDKTYGTRIVPAVSPTKVPLWVTADFDQVVYLGVNKSDERVLVLSGHPSYGVNSRVGEGIVLPESIINPTFVDVWDVFSGKKVKSTTFETVAEYQNTGE